MDRRTFIKAAGIGMAGGFENAEGQPNNMRQKYLALEKGWAGAGGKSLRHNIEELKKLATERRKESGMEDVATIHENRAEMYQLQYELLKHAEFEMDSFEKLRKNLKDETLKEKMLDNSSVMRRKFFKCRSEVRNWERSNSAQKIPTHRPELSVLRKFLPELEQFINELRAINKALEMQLIPINLSGDDLLKRVPRQ